MANYQDTIEYNEDSATILKMEWKTLCLRIAKECPTMRSFVEFLLQRHSIKDPKEKKFRGHLAAIVRISYLFAKQYGIALDDAIQVGCLAIWEEIAKGKNIYYKNIFWTVKKALFLQDGLIRIPIHLKENLQKVVESYTKKFEFSEEGLFLQTKPVIEHIAKELYYPEPRCEELLSILNNYIWVQSIEGLNENQIPTQEQDFSELYQSEARRYIDQALDTLTDREENIIRKRFGLWDDKPMSYYALAEENNVTEFRIREIEAKAMRKLRHPHRSKRYIKPAAELLEYFLDEQSGKIECANCGKRFVKNDSYKGNLCKDCRYLEDDDDDDSLDSEFGFLDDINSILNGELDESIYEEELEIIRKIRNQ